MQQDDPAGSSYLNVSQGKGERPQKKFICSGPFYRKRDKNLCESGRGKRPKGRRSTSPQLREGGTSTEKYGEVWNKIAIIAKKAISTVEVRQATKGGREKEIDVRRAGPNHPEQEGRAFQTSLKSTLNKRPIPKLYSCRT